MEQTTTSIPKEKSKQERLFLTKQGNFVTEWDIKKAAQIIFNQNLTQINFDQFITNCLGIDAELDPDMDTLSKIKILLRHIELCRMKRHSLLQMHFLEKEYVMRLPDLYHLDVEFGCWHEWKEK